MKNLTKIVFLICLAGVLTLFFVNVFAEEGSFREEVQSRGVLRLGVAAAEPHCIKNLETGEWNGVAVDIIRELANVLGVKFEAVDTTWDYIIAGLQAKKWDIAAALNATPARTLAVDFSVPFYFFEVSVVYNKENPKFLKKPTKVGDFDREDISLSVLSGSAQDKSLSRVIKKAKILRFSTVDEGRMAVISGRTDAIVSDDATNRLFARTYPWAEICLPDPPLSREGMAFGFREGSYADIETLNILITNMRDSGKLRELETKYGTILK